MAGILSWGQQDNIVSRYSIPLHTERKGFNLDAQRPPLVKGDDEFVNSDFESPERSSSRGRSSHINDAMKWEDEEKVKKERLMQSEKIQVHGSPARSKSTERKWKEGTAVSEILHIDKASPYRER